MSPQIKTAFFRAAVGGFISAGLTFFATLAASGAADGAIAAGTAFFTYLAARGGAEGFYDNKRQREGRVQPGDVQAATS